MDVGKQVRELTDRWAQAELDGDVAGLDALAADDFTLVGPLGFVLNKQAWLGRYRSGALATRTLTTKDLQVRGYGDTAVAIGQHAQKIEYGGNPSEGEFRITHIAVRQGDRWLLAGQHLSQIAAPPGA